LKVSAASPRHKVEEHEVVIDDFIRNFLSKYKMGKTLSIFQQEWYELHKKGVFMDNHLGMITDIQNKNSKLENRITKMRTELSGA